MEAEFDSMELEPYKWMKALQLAGYKGKLDLNFSGNDNPKVNVNCNMPLSGSKVTFRKFVQFYVECSK